ncbi:tetracycline resistance protein, class A [Escherichia coli BWH 24]|nr:tetracycline resistance protein, class A [Escherichia coli BWH 24]
MKPNRPLIVILSTVALDAVGIGLIMPVLPGLLRDLVHSNDVTAHYGILLALYALMQFACAPVLGALSDRFGRRPVLLVSLAGAAVDYAIMATAPFLWVLYIAADRGRHHRGDWGGSRRLYCRLSLMAMSARGTSAS